MALPVDVRSVDVLVAVREGFILFSEDAQNALGAMEMETRRCIDWLTHDQRIHWQTEAKKRKEKLNEAKAELHRKQLSQMFGGQSHDSEQREAVRDATRRLEEAEDKIEEVARWIPVVQRAVMEYNGQARSFADLLEFDVDRSIELLDRMITAIEEYTAITAPVASKPLAPVGSSTSSTITHAETPAPTTPTIEPVPQPTSEETTVEDELQEEAP